MITVRFREMEAFAQGGPTSGRWQESELEPMSTDFQSPSSTLGDTRGPPATLKFLVPDGWAWACPEGRETAG